LQRKQLTNKRASGSDDALDWCLRAKLTLSRQLKRIGMTSFWGHPNTFRIRKREHNHAQRMSDSKNPDTGIRTRPRYAAWLFF
jgi:predicted membrane GTPase involved in stress response